MLYIYLEAEPFPCDCLHLVSECHLLPPLSSTPPLLISEQLAARTLKMPKVNLKQQCLT